MKRAHYGSLAVVVCGLMIKNYGFADEPIQGEDITVTAPRDNNAASYTDISAAQIAVIPTQIDSADILRTVPGLQIAQHEGGGKANEYMLRGFYADHGTDIAFNADGLPLNLVSHGHGQGYTDLHMLIPETVQDINVRKGPYDPQQGDLATAGSVDLKFFDKLPESFLDVTGGSFNTGRVAAGVNRTPTPRAGPRWPRSRRGRRGAAPPRRWSSGPAAGRS